MPEVPPLPKPDSPELKTLVGSEERAIYKLLYENRRNPLSMREIRDRIGAVGDNEQLGRRRRVLNKHFVIEKVREGKTTRYRLAARKPKTESEATGISERVRAQVLQFGRCEMCGRTVKDHGVVLQVDHKMPKSWGGINDIENLQALCEECNRGKKNYFRTLERFGPQIRKASEYAEPQKRIGELLRAVHPQEIRSDIVEMVAHRGQYQEDWQRRLRELRDLGWDYEVRRETDNRGRVRTYYKLTKWRPWPAKIRSHIK